ncbi:MAG: glycosyltransferase [Acetobacteraceae bacterium]|nr:glycosyltransferase [Acetobacteraceae bacterium]
MNAAILYVVPTFNRAGDMARTLGAIAAQDWPDALKSILVIDNSSTDNTSAVLAELAQTLPCRMEHLRKAPEGPTVARNIGLRRGAASASLVALVDSDVELDPGWTRATVAALEADPGLAQVGGKLVFGHDPAVLNSYGGVSGFLGLAWDRGEGGDAADETAPRDALWINTAAVMLRPGPALAVGGFDEAFFYGYEEPDLGLRLAIAGWRARVVPDAVALHHAGVRVVAGHPELVFHYTKNRIRMGLKCWAPPLLAGFAALNLLYGLADALLHAPRRARMRALWWNVIHLRDTWRHRRLAQAARTVPDNVPRALLSPHWLPPTRLRGHRRRLVRGSVFGAGTDDRLPADGKP